MGAHMRGVAAKASSCRRLLRVLAGGAICCSTIAMAQVFTVSPEKIEGHYLEFHPTHVELPSQPLSARGHQELIRFFTAEQGFAMRPLPLASRGLTLVANGDLKPAGSDYINELNEHGTSAKPGDRCVI